VVPSNPRFVERGFGGTHMTKRAWIQGAAALLGVLATFAYILVRSVREEIAAGLIDP